MRRLFSKKPRPSPPIPGDNPLETAKAEEKAAEFFAKAATPTIEDVRIAKEAAKFGVAPEEIRRLPQRPLRWDERPGHLPGWVTGDSGTADMPSFAYLNWYMKRLAQHKPLIKSLGETYVQKPAPHYDRG